MEYISFFWSDHAYGIKFVSIDTESRETQEIFTRGRRVQKDREAEEYVVSDIAEDFLTCIRSKIGCTTKKMTLLLYVECAYRIHTSTDMEVKKLLWPKHICRDE